MNVSEEDLNDEFQTFDVSLDNEDIVDRLKELCQMYRMDASAIAMEWVAFAHTNKQSGGLSLETLDQLDRLRLSKKGGKVAKTPSSKRTSTKIYDVNALESVADTDDLLGAYSTPGKKPNSNKRQHTPDHPTNKRITGLSQAPVAPFSPASLSPANATPAKKYSSRSNGGKVEINFGAADKVSWKTSRNQPCSINLQDTETSLVEGFKYMFQKLSDKAIVLNDLIEDLSDKIQKHHGIEELSHLAMPAQEPVTVIGRIGCDAQGKLNAKSVELEGSREHSSGKRIPIDISEVKQFSLFPGQVVAMDGINSTGDKFVASKIYEGVPLPISTKKPDIPAEGLRVVMACGPFTTTDSLLYEPLADLIKYLQREAPDVCILMGPFVDVKNPEIEKGKLDVTYQDFFTRTIEQISNALQRLPTRLVIVPSYRDVHHEPVYPQPPFSLPRPFDKQKIQFVSDPSTINIDGVVFGFTSTDVLFHLGSEEISSTLGTSDRLARLAHHIITQQNYYPLYPPSEEINIDYDHFEVYAKLPVTPHVLITPSELRFFIKDVLGCCCINPGRLTKGQVGGTYARMLISPQKANKPLIQSISAEVVRI